MSTSQLRRTLPLIYDLLCAELLQLKYNSKNADFLQECVDTTYSTRICVDETMSKATAHREKISAAKSSAVIHD